MVTQLGASQRNNGQLLQSHNDNDSATGCGDNNAWLCQSNVWFSVNTLSLSGWQILYASPLESNCQFKPAQLQSYETHYWLFSCQ